MIDSLSYRILDTTTDETQLATFGCFHKKQTGKEEEQCGPMVPEVYRKYKIFGSTMIPDTKLQAVFNEQDASLMAAMLNTAARYSTKKLVQNAKSQAPWKTAYIPGMVCTIPEQAICQYAKRAYQ